MAYQMIPYPSIPEDTRRAATAMYGKSNINLRIGDHLNELLYELVPLEFDPGGMGLRSFEVFVQYNLLTIYQYSEELTNAQILDAVRNRVDLKYAMHLPLNIPRFDPQSLCEFRRHLFNDSASAQIFLNLFDRLTIFGLLEPDEAQPVAARQVLVKICTLHRFEEVVEAMYQALEALAVSEPEWLRGNMLPYWYDRYNRSARLSPYRFSGQGWNTRVLQIGSDIQYLLGKVDLADQPQLTNLKEIRNLHRIWEDQFVVYPNPTQAPDRIEWMLTRCASCSNAE